MSILAIFFLTIVPTLRIISFAFIIPDHSYNTNFYRIFNSFFIYAQKIKEKKLKSFTYATARDQVNGTLSETFVSCDETTSAQPRDRVFDFGNFK